MEISYRRRLKICFLLYIGAILIAAHIYGWRLFHHASNTEKPSSVSANYSQIVGDHDDSLPANFRSYTLSQERRYISSNNSGYKIIAVDSQEYSQENLNGCPDWRCRIVISYFSNIDTQEVDAFVIKGGLPSGVTRRHNQYFVFFSQESPLNWGVPTQEPSMFNLTMGYRRDADVPCPYGYFIKRPKPSPFNQSYLAHLERLIKGKTKLAAWFVSNCNTLSGRMELVRELQKYMEVDIYGGCGDHNCNKNFMGQSNDCDGLLEKKYKFYFAFENSICKDYITEKFWGKIALNIVVVVLSRRIVELYAPPKSYIAADDSGSPKELADYLIKLHQNNELYMEYFKWRVNYESIYLDGISHDIRERPWGFCRLCKLLWKTPRVEKIYHGLLSQGYWSADQCYGSIFNLMDKKGNMTMTNVLTVA